MIKFSPIIAADIDFLAQPDTLYSIDFRATSSTDEALTEMWMYENELFWILSNQYVVGNEDHDRLKYSHHNHLVLALKDADPRVSLYRRLPATPPSHIRQLYVGIPHVDADEYASQHQLKVNYSTDNFKLFNDKLRQKKYWGGLAPNYQKVMTRQDIQKAAEDYPDGFLKNSLGSGGQAVMPIQQGLAHSEQSLQQISSQGTWFVEEQAAGKPHSIQCCKEKSGITVFGWAEQIMRHSTHFAGAKLNLLTALPITIRQELTSALARLTEFLADYNGFFGVDFMFDGASIRILEANIRLTALTIPTLMANERSLLPAEYKEFVSLTDRQSNDFVLLEDTTANCFELLRPV